MLIVSSEQMNTIEKSALNYDMTMPRLMENAGSAAAAFIRGKFPVDNMNCIIFSGNGNNGGDGIVVARRLQEYGAHVILVFVSGLPKTPQANQMLEFAELQKVPVLYFEQNKDLVEQYTQHADLIVDAVYGIGFRGQLTGQSLAACSMMNSADGVVVSLDAPSGIQADRGTVARGCVKAEYTVAFQLLKPLHVLPESLVYCGEIEIVDIGIPQEIYESYESMFEPISRDYVKKSLPKREKDAHKGNFGKLLLIAGSNPYRGAAALAVSGALRSGVGLCVIAAPEVVCASVTQQFPEAILQPLPVDSKGHVEFVESRPLLEKQLATADAVVFGPGVGVEEDNLQTLIFLIKECRVPLLLDADGLHLLSQHSYLLRKVKAPLILTPHPGEMAALTNETSVYVQKNRLPMALDFSQKHQTYLVLKGAETLVASPEGRVKLNPTGNPGLARGGSGDVLAGILGGLVSQGLALDTALSCGVWLHGTAADRCAKRLSVQGMLPGDLLFDLCQVFLDLEEDDY